MANKNIYSRMQQKHDIQANWEKAINFIPLEGEIIVYSPDENNLKPRVKIGDGKTSVNNLAFIETVSDDLPEYAKLKYAVADTIKNSEAVTVIEDTDASVTAGDNSAYFSAQNIVVEQDTYKLNKEAMLALQDKKITGNGSVAWNDWDTIHQGMKDSEDATMLSSTLKVRYSDDPVYMSMKLPSEANFSTDLIIRPCMRQSDSSGTYTIVDNMGGVVPIDYTKLPDEVVICVGNMSLYTLSREPNAKWKLHTKCNIPNGYAMYYLPWSTSNDANVSINANKVSVHENYIRYTLTKDDFAPSSSVSGSLAKCLHFWDVHKELDLANNLAVITFFEVWTETPSAVGNLYTSAGCDQKSADKTKIKQNFWGRNVLLQTKKNIIIGHNISDTLYDELRDTPNDPRNVYEDYTESYSVQYDVEQTMFAHNTDKTAHQDIREEIDTYLGDMQSRINQVSEVVRPMEVLIPSINLNDGIYETGYIASSGMDYDGYHTQSFRSKNYIPVEGGRTITLYYDKAEWNNNNFGKAFDIVEYDSTKTLIGERQYFPAYVNNSKSFTLNANTAYIRIAFNNWADFTTPISDIKVAIYYIEDVRLEFVEYGFGSEMVYGILGTDVYLTMPDGTMEQLPNVIDTLAKKTDLSPMVDEALAIAKASGDFKGDKGDTGATGSQGPKGDTGATGSQGPKGDTGAAGKDGSNGKDGVSVTHSWNGTTLTVTSASGTSSVNLKGEKGDTGATGKDGTNGTNGTNGKDGTSVTVKSVNESSVDGGSNVVTFSDGKTVTIKNGKTGKNGSDATVTAESIENALGYTPLSSESLDEITSEIAGKVQLTPEFADSIEDCTDTTKMYVLPDGFIYRYLEVAGEQPNIVITSEAGGYYYVDQWNPLGKFNANTSCYCKSTNVIPVTPGDQFSYKGYGASTPDSVVWLTSAQAFLSEETHNAKTSAVTVTAPENAAYVRFFSFEYTSKESGVVLDVQWIKCQAAAVQKRWVSTGLSFVPADNEDRIIALEKDVAALKNAETEVVIPDVLKGKKIVYDGDSICQGYNASGGYPAMIAAITGGTVANQSVGGARLCSLSGRHSVVDNVSNLPDGDLYCFQGGINDWWANTPLGTFTQGDYTGTVDPATIYGAMETIFRYALTNFVGKPVCFIITHKIQNNAYSKNTNGHTFWDYRKAMIDVCEKYSIPYYDAFAKSGLNGWNDVQNNAYLTGNSEGTADGIHPNEEGYKRYYVPQLLNLFREIMPIG